LNVVKLTFVSVRESDGVPVERRHIGTTVPANLDVNYSPFAVAMSRCDGAGNADYLAKLETSHFSPLWNRIPAARTYASTFPKMEAFEANRLQ
jgi:hypothetical protein